MFEIKHLHHRDECKSLTLLHRFRAGIKFLIFSGFHFKELLVHFWSMVKLLFGKNCWNDHISRLFLKYFHVGCIHTYWSEIPPGHLGQREKQVAERRCVALPFAWCEVYVELSGRTLAQMLRWLPLGCGTPANFISFFTPFLLLDLLLYMIPYQNLCIWLDIIILFIF